MIREALEFLANQALAASELKPVKLDDPSRLVYLTGRGDKVEVILDPPPRDHSVGSLADLIAFAGESGCASVVWYDESSVVHVIDDDGHRANTVTLTLKHSDQFATLLKLKACPWLDLKAFIRLLRIDLAGAMPPGLLLDRIRKLKFENGMITSAEIGKGRESMGRQLLASVSGEHEIPDEVTLEMPIYKTPGETDRYPFRCAVEIDPTLTQPFRLTPMPDEIERVTQFAMDSISDRLKEGLPDGIPAYYGKP